MGRKTNDDPVIEKPSAWQSMSAEDRTSWFISEMLSRLTKEQIYESAMDGMLDIMSSLIDTDRLSVFECGGQKTTITFERCRAGVPSLLGVTMPLPRAAMKKWFSAIEGRSVALVPDISKLENFSKPLYDWCIENGIESLMAAPFYNEGEIVGFLGAYNSQMNDTIDFDRLFSAVSTFIGARIENRRLINSLEWAVDHDPLTELLNRRGLGSALQEYHEANPESPIAVILVDLDDFKRINDVYGHEAGDEALRRTARAMREAFPASAVLSRNGGDEFIIALLGDDSSDVESLVAGFVERDIEFEINGARHPLTASLGYAQFPEQASDIEGLYAKADVALYSVKLSGKAGYGRYVPGSGEHYRFQLGFSTRDIVENIPYNMVIHRADEQGSILFASAKFSELVGCDNMFDMMQFSKGMFGGIVHDDDFDRVFAAFTEKRIHGTENEKLDLDFSLVTKGGETKNVSATSRLVTIEDVGKVFYTLVRHVG